MNLITANQVTDRCSGLSYLSSKPGAADVLQVVTQVGTRALLAGTVNQYPQGWATMAHGGGSGFSDNPRVPSFTVLRHT